jgi:hypothetical protein
MNIELHIERLVLDGLPAEGSSAALREAIQMELARLLRSRGLSHELRGGIAVPRVRGGTVGIEHQPAKLGQSIARAVHEGIGPPKGGERHE